MARSELSEPHDDDLMVSCQRCGRAVPKDKASIVSTRKKTMHFCDNCFHAVFKYDESLKTIPMIYDQGGRRVPFVVRSTNWHKSSYMVVKEVRAPDGSGNKKQIFIGDMYLRGVLKEQNRPLGKANFFNWVSWSEELAQKYKEPVVEGSSPAEGTDASSSQAPANAAPAE